MDETWTFENGARVSFSKGNGEEYTSTIFPGEFVMRPNDYIALSSKTDLSPALYVDAQVRAANEIELLHVALGLGTEAGEFTDALKKYILYGKPLDRTNLEEELGDILWYMSLACRILDISFEELMERNYRKLKVRYPEKFTNELALNRDLDKERQALEGK